MLFETNKLLLLEFDNYHYSVLFYLGLIPSRLQILVTLLFGFPMKLLLTSILIYPHLYFIYVSFTFFFVSKPTPKDLIHFTHTSDFISQALSNCVKPNVGLASFQSAFYTKTMTEKVEYIPFRCWCIFFGSRQHISIILLFALFHSLYQISNLRFFIEILT